MSQCERCHKKHNDLFIQFYVWEEYSSCPPSDLEDVSGWADTICGLTPETAVNQYIEDVHNDNGVEDGDEFTVWIRPVNDDRFGLRKYVVTAEIQVSFTSGRISQMPNHAYA